MAWNNGCKTLGKVPSSSTAVISFVAGTNAVDAFFTFFFITVAIKAPPSKNETIN
jgi:hypothetical protein